MEDNSILGTLGVATFWTGAGLAGYHGYKHIKDASEVSNYKKNVTSNTRPVRPTEVLKSNAKDLGLDNINAKYKMEYLSLNDLSKFDNINEGYISELRSLSEKLNVSPSKIAVNVSGTSAAEIIFTSERGRFSVGKMTKGTHIVSANSVTPGYASSKYLSKEAAINILYNPESVNLGSQSNYIDFNTAKLQHLNDVLSSGTSSSSFSKIVSDFESKNILPNYSTNPYNIARFENSVIPFDIVDPNTGKRISWGPHNPNTRTLLNNIIDLSAKVKDKTINPTFGQNTSSLSSGITTFIKSDPANISSLLGGKELEGGHKLSQMLNKPTRALNPRSFKSNLKGAFQNSTFTEPIQTFVASETDELFNMIKHAGMGNEGAAVFLGEEGYIASHSLARKGLVDNLNKTIKINNEVNITNDMQRILHAAVTRAQSVNKSSGSTAPIMPLTKADTQKYIKEILNDPNMSGKFGSGISLDELFGNRSIALTIGNEGPTTIAGGSGRYIDNIYSTADGIGITTRINSTLNDTGGKTWGTIKAIKTGNANVKDMAFTRLALEEHIKAGEISYSEAKQILHGAINGNQSAEAQLSNILESRAHIYSELDENIRMTHMPIRDAELQKGDSGIRRATMMETMAAKNESKYLGEFYDMGLQEADGKIKSVGLRQDIASYSHAPSLSGYGLYNKAEANYIMVDRLTGQNYNAAAQYLERNFNHQDLNNILESFMPHLSDGTRSGHIGISLDKIHSEDIDVLFGDDLTKARTKAESLIDNKFGAKNVSDKTRYYIEVAHGANKEQIRRVPIPMFDSNYTSYINDFRIAEEGEPIAKQLTSAIRSYITAEKSGNFSNAYSAWNRVEKETAALLGSQGVFTKGQQDFAKLSQLSESGFLNPENLKKLKHPKSIENILKRYGIDSIDDLNSKAIHGYGNERFWKVAQETDVYKEMFAKFGGSHAEFQQLKKYDLMKEGLFEIISRNPSYTHEGTTISRMINLTDLYTDVYRMQGLDRDTALRKAGDLIGSNQVEANPILKAMFAGDLDDDMITAINILDNDVRKATKASYMDYESPLRMFYGNKNTLKQEVWGRSALNMADLTLTEQKYISKFFNAGQPYMLTSLRDSDNIFKESMINGTKVAARTKQAILNHIVTTLPETAIGSKQIRSPEAAEELLGIFRRGDIDSRINTLREFSKGKYVANGIDYMSEAVISNSEIKTLLERGDSVHPSVVKFMTKNINNLDELKELINVVGDTNTVSKSSPIRQLQANLNMGKTKQVSNAVSDFASDVVPKVIKNKKFLGVAAGTLLAGYMLTPKDNDIKHQEVREASRPENQKAHATPIDPPSGVVSRPTRPGKRINIRGTLPNGVGVENINNSLSSFGMNLNSSYINNNSHLDAETVKKLQKEEILNSWNLS